MATPDSAGLTRRGMLRAPIAMVGLAAACVAAPDGWSEGDLIQPKVLAARLADKKAAQPAMFHVGFGLLYRNRHIPGSVYAGPGNKPEGLEVLKKAVAALPKDREIVVYCGCCPWIQCPNMKPAFALLRQLGFKRVKALVLESSFAKDWIQMGYPVDSAQTGA